ncbi:hypothetical protein DTO212C5_1509 [Paecilomyces variotii]|nr:hypothetical protein DTO212C5_1509 [Paecilomyces variotii]
MWLLSKIHRRDISSSVQGELNQLAYGSLPSWTIYTAFLSCLLLSHLLPHTLLSISLSWLISHVDDTSSNHHDSRWTRLLLPLLPTMSARMAQQ